ncbi:MAG: ABC transporter substrate-binding protein [Deinococcota bacterium]
MIYRGRCLLLTVGLVVTFFLGTVQAQQQGGTLLFAAESMGDTLETGLWAGFGSIHVSDNIGEGLIRSNFTDGEPEPALAESWIVSENGLTYTFTIRADVTFHDGTPLDADAVVRSLTRMSNEADSSYLPGLYMEPSHGATNWESITAVDSSTVEIVLTQPDSTQLHKLSRPSAYIVSPAALDEFGTDIGTNWVGAGPFKLERFVPGQEAVLTAFEDYWAGRPFLDSIIIRGYPDEASILAGLEAGEINFTMYAPFLSTSRLQASSDINVDVGGPLVNTFIGANANQEPTSNLDIRRAVNYAVNREAVTIVGLNGLAEPPASILCSRDLGYDASGQTISTYNPELAQEFLAASGYELPVAVTLSYENNRFWPQVAELVKADLEAVGFSVTLEPLDSGTFWGKAADGTLQLSLNQRSIFLPDPNDRATILHSVISAGGQTWHQLLPMASEMDALLDQGLVEQDTAVRADIYAQVQALALEDFPYTYLGCLTPPVFTSSNVSGVPVQAAAAGRVVLRGVWLE